MKLLTNLKEGFQKEGKRKFSFIRFLLFILFFVAVVGGFLGVKTIEFFYSKGLKSRMHGKSALNDYSVQKNQTNETKKEEVVHEAMVKSINGSAKPISNENFTNKTISSPSTVMINMTNGSVPTFMNKDFMLTLMSKNSTISGNETQLKTFSQKKKSLVEKQPSVEERRLARSFFEKETIEKKLPQGEGKIAEKIDSEEKLVEKKDSFSLFQGGKKLENLLLKAEEETAKGNYQLAKYFYEKYLEEKKDPQVYNNYGGVLFLTGDYEGAEKAFVMALSLEQNPVIKFNLILTKIKLNQTEEACQMFKKFQKELEQLKEVVFIKNICFL
jgi:tetratricopeptide (TPR) repeat protein